MVTVSKFTEKGYYWTQVSSIYLGHWPTNTVSLYSPKRQYTDFHWAQCNDPSTLALGNFRCFSLISTKFAVVVATALSYRFKGKSYTGWPRSCPLVGKCKKSFFYRNMHNLKWWLWCPKPLISVSNWFQPNIERFEQVSQKHWMFLIVKSKKQ